MTWQCRHHRNARENQPDAGVRGVVLDTADAVLAGWRGRGCAGRGEDVVSQRTALWHGHSDVIHEPIAVVILAEPSCVCFVFVCLCVLCAPLLVARVRQEKREKRK